MATLFDTTVTHGNHSVTNQGSTTTWSGFIADTGGVGFGATTIGSVNDTNISTINSNWTGGLTLAYEITLSGSSTTYFGGKAGGGGDQRLSDSSWDNIDIGSNNRTRTSASFSGSSSWGSKWAWSGSLLNTNTTFINVDDGVVGDSIPDTPDWGPTANETPLDTYAESNVVTISGMDTGATTAGFLTIQITGDGGGTVNAQYKFNSSPWINIALTGSAVSNISNGDTIQLRSKYSAINTTVKVKFASTGVPDTFFTMNTVDALAPTISSVGEGGIELANETVTVNLSSNGQGGTGLYYAQSDTNTLPGEGNWQTSNQFSHPRNTTKYYWANRYSAGTVSIVRGGSASFEKFVDYLNPKAFSYTVDGGSGVVNFPYSKTSFVTTISGADTDHTYQLLYGTTSATTSAGTIASDGDITVSGSEMVPAGGQMVYQMRVQRGTTSGGNGSYQNFGTTFTRYRYPQTPSGLTTFTDGETEASSGTFTITVGGTAGAASTTITLSSNYTTNAVANGSAIASVVRSGDFVYARNTGANGLQADAAIATPATYLSADTTGYSFVTTPDPQTYGAGNPSFDFDAGKANHTVAIFEGSTIRSDAQTGATDYNGIATNADVAAGGSRTYNLKTKRNEAGGGNPNAGYSDTNVQTTVREYPQTATAVTLGTDPGTENSTATFAVTAANVLGGTTTITKNANYTTDTINNGGNLSIARSGTTVYVRNTGANGLQADAVLTTPAKYIAPATYTRSDFTVLYNTAEHYDVLTSFPANDNYEVLTGGYTGTVRGTQSGGGGSSSVIAVTNINSGGDNVTYYIRGYRAEDKGGDGNYDNMDTYIVGEFPQESTVLETFTDQGTEDTSGTFTTKITPGTGANTVQITLASNYDSLQGNNTNLDSVVRAGDTVYVRTTGGNGLVTDSTVTTPATYLAPKAYTLSNNDTENIAANTSQFAVGHSNTDTDHSYRVLYGSSTPNTDAGSRTGNGNIIIDGAELPAKGYNMNYATQVKRGLDSGGNNQWVETSTFTKRRFIDAPTITVGDDSNAGTSVTVTVTSSAVSNVTSAADAYQVQGDPEGDGTFTSYVNMDSNRQGTFTQDRNVTTADYRVKAKGANGLETTATFTDYNPGYLLPDDEVSFQDDTLTVGQNDTQAIVVLSGVARPTDTIAIRTENGSTNLKTGNASSGGAATIQFPHGLSIGGSNTYEIFTLRDTSTGGDGVTYYETNDTFTVERLDTTADAITFGSDLTTVNLSSVHYATEQVTGITAAVTVSSANGSSIPFYVSASATPSTTASDYNNTNKTINNNEYIHLRAVASGSYSTQKFVTISVGDPAVSATWRVTTKANVAPFDLGDAAAPREINTTYTSNTITISGLNTGQTASASVSGGQLSKNGGAFAQVVVTVQNGDTLQVRGTSSGNYDGSTVNVTLTAEARSDTFSITTETKPTTPTGITIANDTTTTSASVSLQATAAGGTGGTLRISEDDSTYDADEVANFTFTRGTPKILYAKRFGTYVNSDLFTRAAFTLAYIPPEYTSITASPSSPTASSVDMTVSISGGDSTTIYYVYNSSKTTLLGFRTGNGTITFTDAGLADGTTGTYAVQAKRPEGSGGDNALTDTGVTFQIAFDSNTANTPPSISVSASNSTPAVSTQVTLSATASDSDGSISSISWTQVGGPTTTPSPTSSSNSTTLSSTITTPSSPTTLRYKATATDNDSDSTDSSILVIEVGGGGEYGFEVFNSSERKVLSVSSSVPRLVASGFTGTISWSSSPATINTTVSVSGLTNDGTWKVLIYTPYFNFNVSHEVSLGTGQFTVITTAENNAGVNQSLIMYYYVIRI